MSKGTKQYAIRISELLMKRIRARMERRGRNPRLPPQTLADTVRQALEELLDLDERRSNASKRAAARKRGPASTSVEEAHQIATSETGS